MQTHLRAQFILRRNIALTDGVYHANTSSILGFSTKGPPKNYAN